MIWLQILRKRSEGFNCVQASEELTGLWRMLMTTLFYMPLREEQDPDCVLLCHYVLISGCGF